MPGMIGEYTPDEVAAMSAEDFKAAQARGFTKLLTPDAPEFVSDRPEFAGVSLPSSAPTLPKVEPSDNVWASKKLKDSNDFICPSGQKCKLRKLQPEALMEAGVLDQVTRLEGLAQELVNRAEGVPPSKQKLPSRDELKQLLDLINVVVPLAVDEPKVHGDDVEDLPADAIRVSDIDLSDRVAIMNEALSGLKAFDNFRSAG